MAPAAASGPKSVRSVPFGFSELSVPVTDAPLDLGFAVFKFVWLGDKLSEGFADGSADEGFPVGVLVAGVLAAITRVSFVV